MSVLSSLVTGFPWWHGTTGRKRRRRTKGELNRPLNMLSFQQAWVKAQIRTWQLPSILVEAQQGFLLMLNSVEINFLRIRVPWLETCVLKPKFTPQHWLQPHFFSPNQGKNRRPRFTGAPRDSWPRGNSDRSYPTSREDINISWHQPCNIWYPKNIRCAEICILCFQGDEGPIGPPGPSGLEVR